jgi:hypothetical protein
MKLSSQVKVPVALCEEIALIVPQRGLDAKEKIKKISVSAIEPRLPGCLACGVVTMLCRI